MKILDRDGDFNFALFLTMPLAFVVNSAIEYSTQGPSPLIISSAISLVSLGALAFILREQLREDEFRDWALQHEAELHHEGAAYRGVTLTLDSRVRRYRYTYSLLLININTLGRPLIHGGDARSRWWSGYNIITVVLGWWFVFMGPVITVKVLARNLRHGPEELTMAEYLHGLRNPESPISVSWPS